MDPVNDLMFMGIAIRFPSLVDAKGVMPWSPNDLDEWAASCAAMFKRCMQLGSFWRNGILNLIGLVASSTCERHLNVGIVRIRSRS